MDEMREYTIHPTAPQVTEQYSDIALTGLFNAHTAIINSERQVIWQRYNVFLVANAVIFGFITGGGRTITERLVLEVVAGVLLGFLLCSAWWIITREGWMLLTMRRDKAAEFAWRNLDREANPFQIGVTYERGVMGGRIYLIARVVILIFVAGYIFLLAYRLFFR